jgi:hypothetical protein
MGPVHSRKVSLSTWSFESIAEFIAVQSLQLAEEDHETIFLRRAISNAWL